MDKGSFLRAALGSAALVVPAPFMVAAAQVTSAEESEVGMSDIVVTARRREERLQDVPVAVTVIEAEKLERNGNFAVNDLAQSVPNLSFNNQLGSRSDVVFSLRGQSKVFGGRFPSAIVYFAEVPILRFTSGQFFDLQGVQALRGPQGTLFGRVTDGGNIMVSPVKPSNSVEGYVEAKAGSSKLRTLTAALNVPIVDDRVLLRGAVQIARRDGYTRNLVTGRDLDDVHSNSYRLSLTLRPTDTIENLTILSYNKADENGSSNILNTINIPLAKGAIGGTAQAFGVPAAQAEILANRLGDQFQAALTAQQSTGPRTASIGSLLYGENGGIFNKRRDIYAINTTTIDVGSDTTIKNIFAYVRTKHHYGSDFDGSSVAYVDIANPFLPSDEFYIEQYSNELQLQGEMGERLTYVVGAYADLQRTPGPAEVNAIQLAVINRSTSQYQRTTSRAVFGQIGYDLGGLADGLKLDAGLRYTKDKARSRNTEQVALWDPLGAFGPPRGFETIKHGLCDATVGCKETATQSSAWTYTLGLNYDFSRSMMAYAKISRGYRPGGVNGTAGGREAEFGPEYDVSIEAGLKADYNLGGIRARTNLALFSDRYTDIQKLVTFINPQSGAPQSIVTNGPSARIKGIELEQSIMPMDGLVLTATWAHLDAKYGKQDPAAQQAACFAPYIGFCNLNRFQASPKNTLSGSAEFTTALGGDAGELSLRANVYYRSSMAAGDSSFLAPTAILPSYTIANASANWSRVMGSPVDIGVFVTNLTNKLYVSGSANLEYLIGFSSYQYAEPRMWGVTVKYNIGE